MAKTYNPVTGKWMLSAPVPNAWSQVGAYTPWNTGVSQASINANPNIQSVTTETGKTYNFNNWGGITQQTTPKAPVSTTVKTSNLPKPPTGGDFNKPYNTVLPQATTTVASPQVPVIKKKTVSEVWYTPTDYTDIETMDINWLKDYTKSLEYDVKYWGKQLNKEEYLKLQKALDKVKQLETVVTNPYEWLIKEQEAKKAEEKKALDLQSQELMTTQQKTEQERLNAQTDIIDQASAEQQRTLGYILWGQGVERSWFAVDQANKISQNMQSQKSLMKNESMARLEKYKAELAGATAEQLQAYDNNIATLQNEIANFTVDNIQKLDEYNAQEAKTIGERLESLVALSQPIAKQAPLTEEEKAIAKQYWTLLIKPDWSVDKEVLSLMQANFPSLINEAVSQWATVAQERVWQTEFWFTNVWDWIIARTNPKTGEIEYTQWPQVKSYELKTSWDRLFKFDPTTGETTEVAPDWYTKWWTPITSVIQKALEKCKTGAQCGKFVNDILEGAWVGRIIWNEYSTKENAIKTIGEAMSQEEIGMWSIFAYPVKWSPYWHIGIITGVNDDWTINLMDYNYKWDEKPRERSNVNISEIMNLWWLISKPVISEDTVDTTKPLTDKQFTQSNQIITSFKSDPQIKAFEEAFTNGTSLLSSLNEASWPWDVSAIFQFMKALDPQSVVREAEFETAAKSAGVWEQFKNIPANKIEWTKLTPAQRIAFGKLAKQFIKDKGNLYQIKYKDWIRRLEKQQIDTNVFPTNLADQIDTYLWSPTQSTSAPSWTKTNYQSIRDNL